MTHPWRIIAVALLCCYLGSWLLLYQRVTTARVRDRDIGPMLLLIQVAGVVALCLAVWGWGR